MAKKPYHIYKKEIGPLTFSLEKSHYAAPHWHENIELIYILDGTAEVLVRGVSHRLLAGDMILINSFEIHEIALDDYVLASFQINLSNLDESLLATLPQRFALNSSETTEPEALVPIKKLLARIVKTGTSEHQSYMLYQGLAYELLSLLSQRFADTSVETHQGKSRQRIYDILQYMNEHYQNHITLQEIASRFYLTVPYVSKLFHQTVGRTFTDYLNELRLSGAMRDLANPAHSIDAVAERSGYINARSFVAAFKKKYHMLPSQYRKQLLRSDTADARGIPPLSPQQHQYLGDLAKYLDPATDAGSPSQVIEVEPHVILLGRNQSPFPHNFRRIIGIGKAKSILFAQTQETLKQAQQDIGYEYVYFHGLFDDEMMLYAEDSDGTMELSFFYIDMAFDFIMEQGLKPILELSFMPSLLAATDENTIYYQRSVMSLPKNMEKWLDMVHSLLLHLQTRYGKAQVSQWPVMIWNKPESPDYLHGIGSCQDYFHLYYETWKVIKRIEPAMLIGSPGLAATHLRTETWLLEFTRLCQAHDCVPAFLSLDYYPMAQQLEGQVDKGRNAQHSRNLAYLQNPDCFLEKLDQINKDITNLNLPSQYQRIMVNEWNSSISHRELLNDTAFKSAYLVKNIVESFDRVYSLGYWVLSDFIEEVRLAGQLFHGGLGLCTYNGIKKPAYHAYMLLARMGDTVETRGAGYLLTSRQDSYQLLLYNYIHFSDLYASGELFDMTFTNRYTPFPEQRDKRFTIPLQGLAAEEYLLTEYMLNRSYGSSYDKWVELGAHPLHTKEEAEYLKHASAVKLSKQSQRTEQEGLVITRTLAPFEIRLIEFSPQFG